MTRVDLLELGLRWRKSGRLVWRPGMQWFLVSPSGVTHRTSRINHPGHETPNFIESMEHPAICVPDLSDVATAGCLVADVRAHHDDPRLYVMLSNDGRAIVVPGRRSIDALTGRSFVSEIQALLAALEADVQRGNK